MALKTVGAVFIATLVTQSCTLGLKTPQDGSSVDGFYFYSGETADHKELSMNAATGQFLWRRFISSKGPWSFTPGKTSNTVTTTVSFPGFGASYANVQASADEASLAYLGVFVWFGETNFTLSLTAKGDNKKCKVETKVSPLAVRVRLLLDSDGEVAAAFKVPSAMDEVNALIWKTVNQRLLSLLNKKLVPEALRHYTDWKVFCQELRVATEANYPTIDFL